MRTTPTRLLPSALAALLLLVGLAPSDALAESRVLSISSPVVVEGNGGTVTATFTVTILCENPLPSVTIPWEINDGTATTANNDYVDTSGSFGQVCPNPGDGQQVVFNVNVTVNGDTDFEPDEMFTLKLNPSVGAPSFTGPKEATATIQNDDPAPVCGNSIVETGEQCDLGPVNGALRSCCSGTCQFAPGTECRSSSGVCDPSETCPANSSTCPADAKSNAPCRAVAGVCDAVDFCDGINNACPADLKLSGNTCNASTGVCDPGEVCDGVNDACPADTGILTSECRASAGDCDPAESCDGVNPDCPTDLLEPDTTVCRPGSGDLCDVDELCTGVDVDCPLDVFEPATKVCRPRVTQACDITEFCTGVPTEPCPDDRMQGRCTCGPYDGP